MLFLQHYLQQPKEKRYGNFSFFDLLDYDYAGTSGYFIMQIPKAGIGENGTIPIWGTNTKKSYGGDRKYYILPQFIKGFVKTIDNGKIKPEDRMIEKKTDYTNDEKYKYKVFDSSVYKDLVFENEYEK